MPFRFVAFPLILKFSLINTRAQKKKRFVFRVLFCRLKYNLIRKSFFLSFIIVGWILLFSLATLHFFPVFHILPRPLLSFCFDNNPSKKKIKGVRLLSYLSVFYIQSAFSLRFSYLEILFTRWRLLDSFYKLSPNVCVLRFINLHATRIGLSTVFSKNYLLECKRLMAARVSVYFSPKPVQPKRRFAFQFASLDNLAKFYR